MIRWLQRLFATGVYGFLYLPLVIVAVFSFNSSKYSLAWKGFTLDWYVKLWQNPGLMTAALNSLVIAAGAATLATLLGTVAAFILHQYRFPGRRLLFGTLFVMMMSPDIVIAISLLLLYLAVYLPLGFSTLLLAHTVLCVPFVATTVYSRFHGFPTDIVDAAKDLGAGEYQIFRYIVLPLATPAVIGGWLLSFTLSLDDVIISFFTTGPDYEVLPLRIYSMVRLGIKPDVNALCMVMMAITIAALVLSRKLLKEKQ
ncbi:spermidine/putrescine ABC transporter permease PotC [uncultured Desulfobulbus sp.]|uniref:spermidine/putrescine ABC transporter permease PotC n=1 Tax=uncultured Desulfobulbus sp. TaxID=239745 RepID=UPI0029C75B07|nr:spermidine/putrescine ABC transporter permease PotC [uncultured Desulfobulbus sp.]